MITLKDLEVQEKPPVDKWAEAQIQLCFSKIKGYQKGGKLPETLTPCEILMGIYYFHDIGIRRINNALEKYNRGSLLFDARAGMSRAGDLVFIIERKPAPPEEKGVSFWTKLRQRICLSQDCGGKNE